MGFFINSDIGYYEGDRISVDDIAVTKRPSPRYQWENDEWVEFPLTPEEIEQIRKEMLENVATNATRSGAFNELLLTSINEYIRVVKTKPAAAGLTDAQIDEYLSDPLGPYYNPGYVKAKSYYNQLEEAKEWQPAN